MRRMGPKRRAWERHVQEALDVARRDHDGVPGPEGVPGPDGVPGPEGVPDPLPPLPVRHAGGSEDHGEECPCALCTTYPPHQIVDNWHPLKGPRGGLYVVREDGGA